VLERFLIQRNIRNLCSLNSRGFHVDRDFIHRRKRRRLDWTNALSVPEGTVSVPEASKPDPSPKPELPSLDPELVASVRKCIEKHGKDAGKCEQLLCGLDPLARLPYAQVPRGESIQDATKHKSCGGKSTCVYIYICMCVYMYVYIYVCTYVDLATACVRRARLFRTERRRPRIAVQRIIDA
jgi:hypothetical protein